MFDSEKLRDIIDGLRKFPKIRSTLLIIAGIFIVIAGLEWGLNHWVRSALRERFVAGGGTGYQLKAQVSWMNLRDLAHGEVKYIRLTGHNCLISDLRYQTIRVDNAGLDFDMPQLLKERKLYLEQIGKTQVQGVITQAALTEYLRMKYPELQPEIRLLSEQIQIAGSAKLFGNPTPVQVAGRLSASGPKTVRFFPEDVRIANRKVPRELLKFISTQLPLSFTIMEKWPLKISELVLKEAKMEIELKEMANSPLSSLFKREGNRSLRSSIFFFPEPVFFPLFR